MRHTSAFLSLIFVLLVGCAPVRPPRPETSTYLVSAGAGFAMTPERGVYCSMGFKLRETFPSPIFVVAQFEDPANSSSRLRVEKTVEVGAVGFMLQSPPVRILTNNKLYAVDLFLYEDEAHMKLLGQHRQKVLFSIPSRYVSGIEQQFSIRIL